MALSLLFLSRAMAIIDYGAGNIPGMGCDSCEFAREFLLGYALIFGIIGGIFGTGGVWAALKGMKETIMNQT
jgi:hypothetical protein